MSKIFAFLITFFFAISSYASTDSSLDFSSDDTSSESDSSSDSDSVSLKRDREDSSDDDAPLKKRPKLSKLSTLDLAFHKAASEFDLDKLKRLLAEGADIDARDKDGSAFRLVLEGVSSDGGACDEYCLQVLDLFLSNEVDVHDAVFYGGAFDILWTAYTFNLSHCTGLDSSINLIINRLVALIEVHALDLDGNTPLAILVQTPIPCIIQGLINAGADVNALNYEGTSVLNLAINALNANTASAELLIQNGAHFGVQELNAAIEVAAYHRDLANQDMDGEDDLADEWEALVARMLREMRKGIENTMISFVPSTHGVVTTQGVVNFPLEINFLIASFVTALTFHGASHK